MIDWPDVFLPCLREKSHAASMNFHTGRKRRKKIKQRNLVLSPGKAYWMKKKRSLYLKNKYSVSWHFLRGFAPCNLINWNVTIVFVFFIFLHFFLSYFLPPIFNHFSLNLFTSIFLGGNMPKRNPSLQAPRLVLRRWSKSSAAWVCKTRSPTRRLRDIRLLPGRLGPATDGTRRQVAPAASTVGLVTGATGKGPSDSAFCPPPSPPSSGRTSLSLSS